MSNHEQLSEPEPGQPNQIDQPYSQLDVITRFVAEAIALGDRDPSTPIPPGDGSTLPPPLREMVQKWLREQEQANNGTPPPPDTPPSPETPQ